LLKLVDPCRSYSELHQCRFLRQADENEVWRVKVNSLFTLPRQMSSGSVYCVTLEGRKPHTLPYFQPQHSVVAPSSSAETNLNAGAHPQTLQIYKHSPIQRYHGRFCIQTASWRLAFTNFSVQKHDRHTHKQKIELFRPPTVREVRLPPNLAWCQKTSVPFLFFENFFLPDARFRY